MRYRLYFIILIFLIYSGCQSGNRDEFVINGTVSNSSGKKLLLQELRIKETITIDSVIPDKDGDFTFRVRATEPSFYLLKADQGNFLSLVAGPQDNIGIRANYGDLSGSAQINGSAESEQYHRFEMITVDNLKKVDTLGRLLMAYQGTGNFPAIRDSLTTEYSKIFDSHRETVMSMIRANPSSLASLLMLNRWFGRSPVFQPETDSLLFFLVDSALMANYPDNAHVKEQHKKMEEVRERNRKRYETERSLAPGSIPPDILLPDPARRMHQLSELKGKPVIVFFWISESKESLNAAADLAKQYHSSLKKKAEVFAVSFDSSRNQWEGAIRSLGLKWINVSDLQGIASPIAERYGLNGGFPAFYLVGADGKIVMKSADIKTIIKGLNEIR